MGKRARIAYLKDIFFLDLDLLRSTILSAEKFFYLTVTDAARQTIV